MVQIASPKPLKIADIKSKLLHPALTSLYHVEIGGPQGRGWISFAKANLGPDFTTNTGNLSFLCCEASLPGSSLATLDLTNDRTGVTEKHAYRRVYDDRIDLTFYVDAQNYASIRYFETWIKFISQESESKRSVGGVSDVGSIDPNFYYRLAFPDEYIDPQGLKITKFEKSSLGFEGSPQNGQSIKKGGLLTYVFVRSFPISISSMPVSYDSSSLLKATVSFSYIRYLIKGTDPKLIESPPEQASQDIPAFSFYDAANLPGAAELLKPYNQASFNSQIGFGGAQVNGFDFTAPKNTPRSPTPTQLRQGTQGLNR